MSVRVVFLTDSGRQALTGTFQAVCRELRQAGETPCECILSVEILPEYETSYVIEIGLGSYGQRKQSSQMLSETFSSKQDALDWASLMDQSEWGNWDVARILSPVAVAS